ncbi:MAG: S-layer homology domain-containing protein, partial [Clostridiales bacterium]|nr:S-layer homology domain-containing protein [Clostridiales bacterium]
LLLLCMALAVLSFSACKKQVAQTTQTEQVPTTPLKVGVMQGSDQTLPFMIARDRGYFEQEGVNLELIAFSNPQDRDSAEQSGQLDGGTQNILTTALMVAGGFDFKITGAVQKEAYFTINSLKTWPGVTQRTGVYSTLNSAGTRGSRTMTGVYLDELFRDVVKLKAEAQSIRVTAGDGYYFEFNLDDKVSTMDAYTSFAGNFKAEVPGVKFADRDGNKLMLAWEGSSGRGAVEPGTLRLVVGQGNEKDGENDHKINLPMWVSNIVSITVNSAAVKPGTGTQGSYQGSVTQETAEAEITLTLKANVSVEDGVASAANTAEEVRKALADTGGQATAAKVLLVNAATQDYTTKTLYTLPADALRLLTEDGHTGLELITDQGSLILSAALLKHLDTGGKEPLVIQMEKADAKAIGDLAAVDITILMGEKAVSSFDGILLKADIPFFPAASMQKEGLVVFNIGEDGAKNLIKLSAYDSGSKSMKIGLTHLSKYSIGYAPLTFGDISGHWGSSHIEFLASRRIVNGRKNEYFDPEGKVTRAEFLKMLAEAVDGIEIAGAADSGFSDVPDNAWYAGYVKWAAGLGIVQGNTDGTFRPDGLITREQMAAMTERFIRAMKLELKANQTATEFTDREQISAFAGGAIKAMQQYGIMQGNPDGSFNPKGQATRAEAAKVISIFIEAVLR